MNCSNSHIFHGVFAQIKLYQRLLRTIQTIALTGIGTLSFSATAADCPLIISTLVSSCTLPSGSTSVETTGSVIGSNGANGSNGNSGTTTPITTAGGPGTAGSNAVSVPLAAAALSVSSDVSPTIKGGNGGRGGNGGTSSSSFGTGANGGAGGLGFNGIYITSALSTLNIASSVSGGAGGSGGNGGAASGSPGRGGNGGTGGNGGHGLYNLGTITTLTNTGSIQGGSGGSGGFRGVGTTQPGSPGSPGSSGNGIFNNTVITTFNNLQGASSTALNYRGNLPTNYNIIVSSASNYGKLLGVSASGTTNFGISSLSTSSTSILNTSLTSVLAGISGSSINVVGGTNTTINNVPSWSATSNGYSYTLSMTGVGTNIWNLMITACSVCNGGSTPTPTPTPTPSDSTAPTPTTSVSSTVSTGTSTSLSSLSATSSPVLAGGALLLTKGERSSQAISVQTEGGTLVAPTTGAAQLSGVLSGVGRLIFSGTGTTVVSGANTYTGGTTVSEGTLSLLGGTLGFGEVYVAPGAQLVGTGTIAGALTVAGLFKPGNSPGYIASSASVNMNNGSVYQQDIAGTSQASEMSPVGATGYYSYLNITGGQFIINAGATLTPALSNLFNSLESGYGSAPYTPVLGDRFRIVTADGGISGKFSSVTQPAELSAGTQLLPFYNMMGSNSIDLAVIPTSYKYTIAATAGNKNAQSVGTALDAMVASSQTGTSSGMQDQLLYATSVNNAASLAAYAQGLAGEVYSAAVAVIAQTTQRVQQAVLTRLGDTMGIGLPNSMTLPAGNTALMASANAVQSGGVASAAVSSNPNVNPSTENRSLFNGNVWGDLAYQKGNRSSDSNSGGWNSNLYQLVFGSDFYTTQNIKVGGGIALSSTTLNPTDGSGTIQQGSVFAYGKMPVDAYIVDAMASFGLNSSDLSRSDVTGLSNGFRNKSISGNDAMVSLGVSRPIDMDDFRFTPYARVTWQMVTQSGVVEGSSASALSVNSFTGNGVRGVLGIAAGSRANDPMTEKYTYRAYVGVGADSSGVLNPTLNASLAGIGTSINTPNAGSTFLQVGLYGTAKVSDNAYAFAGLSGEARSGQTLAAVNVGVRIQF